MRPSLYIYYIKDGQPKFNSIVKEEEIKNIACDDSFWPVLLHISFNPPLASTILENLDSQIKGVYCSRSFLEADFNDGWNIDSSREIVLGELSCYPVALVEGKPTNFNFEDIPKNISLQLKSDTEKENASSDIELNEFGWSVRTKNILEDYRIQKVSDLLKYSQKDLLKLKNFGRKSLMEINNFLDKFDLSLNRTGGQIQLEKNEFEGMSDQQIRNNLSKGAKKTSSEQTQLKKTNVADMSDQQIRNNLSKGIKKNDLEGTKNNNLESGAIENTQKYISSTEYSSDELLTKSLPEEKFPNIVSVLDWFEYSLSKLTEEEQNLIKGRVGYNSSPKTLKELGSQSGVTRERIRQRLSKINIKIHNTNEIIDKKNIRYINILYSLSDKIEELYKNLDEPQLIDYLDEISPILRGIKDFQKVYEYVFDTFLNKRVYIINYRNLNYLSFFNQEELSDLKERLVNHLVLHIDNPTLEIRESIKNEFDSKYRPFLQVLLDDIFQKSILDKDSEGRDIYRSTVTTKSLALVKAIQFIKSSPKPVCLKRLLSEIEKEVPNIISRGIASRLTREGDGVYPFGKGTWGNIGHLNLKENDTERILSICRNFVIKNKEKQFHSNAILKEIPKNISKRINAFKLSALIRENNISNYLGRNTFGPDDDRKERLHDIAISILEKQGRPMRGSQILEEIRKIRDFSSYQIQVKSPLIRIEQGIFGLDYWDKESKKIEESIRTIHDILISVLEENGEPMHYKELVTEVRKRKEIYPRHYIEEKPPLKKFDKGIFGLDFWDEEEVKKQIKKKFVRSGRGWGTEYKRIVEIDDVRINENSTSKQKESKIEDLSEEDRRNDIANFLKTGSKIRKVTENISDDIYSEIKLWEEYSRKEIPNVLGLDIDPFVLSTGVVSLDKLLLLFVTLEKQDLAEEFQYKDKFISPLIFQWQSQNQTRQGSKLGQSLRDPDNFGKKIHLFIRHKKKDGNTTVPFFYCGVPSFLSWEGDKPITIKWELEEAVPKYLREKFKVPDEIENSSDESEINTNEGILYYYDKDKQWSTKKNSEEDIRYEGEIENGKPHRKGAFTYPDGNKYIGEIKDGTYYGQGSYIYSNGDKYSGKWKEGKKHGKGTYIWSNGDKFVGEWKNDKRTGLGTYNWSNGKTYIGEWKDEKIHGQGTYTWPSGGKYIGEWKDGERNGHGTYTYANGDNYEGEWKNDECHGKGTYTSPGGKKYEGTWKTGKYDGQGTYTYANGNKYVGEWKEGRMHGQGIFTSAKGNKYVGKFKDGKRNGKGTFTKADGRKYEGEFRDDKFWNGKQYDKKGKLSEIHENGLEKTSFLKRLFK